MSAAAMLTLTVTTCVGGDLEAYCQATATDFDRHAAALADEASDLAVSTGRTVIARTDAACSPWWG
jgi:hypothetical protein